MASAFTTPDEAEVKSEATVSSSVGEASTEKTGANDPPRQHVDDEELDALLDDALKDFGKPPPSSMKSKTSKTSSANAGSGIREDMGQLWSEEFIKEATAQFEKKMREYVGQSQAESSAEASGSTPVTTGDIHKVVEAATKAAMSSGDSSLEATLNEAIKGLAVNPGVLHNPMGFNENDLAKLMGSLGMGDDVDDKDMNDLLPFMSNMMQKLLSKDLLQPVLADIVDRYPDWLADNREKLPAADFEKYNTQYDNMRKICEEYGKEKPDDSEEVKQQRFDYISDLMLKVQTAGPPPKELVGELEGDGTGFPQFDPSLGGQCSIM